MRRFPLNMPQGSKKQGPFMSFQWSEQPAPSPPLAFSPPAIPAHWHPEWEGMELGWNGVGLERTVGLFESRCLSSLPAPLLIAR